VKSPITLTAWRKNLGSQDCSQLHPAPARVRPNTSFNRTRYGKHRKPGLRHMVHHLSPGLRCSPPRAG
jgi:hypothetical protein